MANAATDGETLVLTTVKVPQDLRDWLRERAARQQRSMAGEIRLLLERERNLERQQGASTAGIA